MISSMPAQTPGCCPTRRDLRRATHPASIRERIAEPITSPRGHGRGLSLAPYGGRPSSAPTRQRIARNPEVLGRIGRTALLPAVLIASFATVPSARAQIQGVATPAAGAETTPATGAGTSPPATGTPLPSTAGPSATPYGYPTPSSGGSPTAAPPVGVSVRLGDVSGLIAAASAVGSVPVPQPGLIITPSLGLAEEYNSNIFDTATDHQSDFITTITPGILINLSTPSTTGTLSYLPSFNIYAEHSSQNNVAQNLTGSLDSTLLPRTLFLSLRAYATQGSSTGGVPFGGISASPKATLTTTTGFSLQPTFLHHFGDIGTFQLSYALQYSSQSGSSAFAPGANQPYFVPTHALANEGTASFVTGPVLGRFNDILSTIESQQSGTGIYNGAYQYVLTNTLRFAVERRVYIFGTGGYESIFYPSVPEVKINDEIWAIGANLTPGPSTSINVGYGHLQGFNSPFLNATVALNPRTKLAISYSDTLGGSLQFLQYALSNTMVNAVGTPVDTQSGTPVLLINQSLALQTSLVRNAIFSTSLIRTWPRDTLALSFFNQNQKLIANAPGVSGFSQRSWTGSINWTHSLTPLLTAGSYFSYGETNSLAGSSELSPVVAGQLSLTYHLSPTLVGSIVYAVSSSSTAGGTALQNIAIIGLTKTF